MHRWISATVTFVLAVGGLSLITTTQTAQAACPGLRIAGTAKRSGDGRALSRFGVAVFIHQRTTPLAKARADTKGGYTMNFCKGDGVRTYARRHHGYLNLDVIAHAWTSNGAGDLFVRTIRVPIHDSRVVVSGKLVRAYTRLERSGRMTEAPAAAPPVGSSLVHPAIMRIEAVRHMQVDYVVNASSVDSVGVHVGVNSGAYSASGSMSMSISRGFNRDGRLRVGSGEYAKAQLIKPALHVEAKSSCYDIAPWGGGGETVKVCDVQSSGDWRGPIRLEPNQHRGCWWSGNRAIRPWSGTTPRVGVNQGVTFNARTQAGVLSNGIDLAITYDAATNYSYVFDQDKPRHFCVSGDKDFVSHSSRLYVSRLDGKTGGGCPPPGRPEAEARGCA
jgi:hypothetical protein